MQEATAAVTSESHSHMEVSEDFGCQFCWTGNRTDKRVTAGQEGMQGRIEIRLLVSYKRVQRIEVWGLGWNMSPGACVHVVVFGYKHSCKKTIPGV